MPTNKECLVVSQYGEDDKWFYSTAACVAYLMNFFGRNSDDFINSMFKQIESIKPTHSRTNEDVSISIMRLR